MKEQADEQCVIEFDQHSSAAKHGAASWSDFRTRCPVAWDSLYGGFWRVTDYEHAAKVFRDGANIAS